MAELILLKMEASGKFKGKDGDPGPPGIPGTNGQPGEKGKPPTADEIGEALAKFPIVLQFTDKTGRVVEETPFVYDELNKRLVAKLAPLRVETYDANGKLTDADEYPLPWGIKIKPIVIPSTKGT